MLVKNIVDKTKHLTSNEFSLHRELDENAFLSTEIVYYGGNIWVIFPLNEKCPLEKHRIILNDEGEHELFVLFFFTHKHISDFTVLLGNERVKQYFKVFF